MGKCNNRAWSDFVLSWELIIVPNLTCKLNHSGPSRLIWRAKNENKILDLDTFGWVLHGTGAVLTWNHDIHVKGFLTRSWVTMGFNRMYLHQSNKKIGNSPFIGFPLKPHLEWISNCHAWSPEAWLFRDLFLVVLPTNPPSLGPTLWKSAQSAQSSCQDRTKIT